MSDDKIRMPSGQGGLIRYFDEYKSKVEFSPGVVIVMCLVVIAILILLNFFGSSILG
ncbi:MAG: preprotein translocase subunit Sec61beta [Candidatus Woesearchaeota archaeon]